MQGLRAVLLAGTVLLPVAGQASEQSMVLCPQLGDMAEHYMSERQAGALMSVAMGKAQLAPETIRKAVTEMVILAYDVPRYNVEENQRAAIIDFRNEIELLCYQIL